MEPQLLSGGGRQIGWHRSQQHARLARLFMWLKSNVCVRAWLCLGPGTQGTVRGFARREEVQVGLAGGESRRAECGHNPAAPGCQLPSQHGGSSSA